MAIFQCMVTSFKGEVLLGVHDMRVSGDTFKIALYTSNASLSANTTAYTASGEVTGTGYTAGGATLTNLGVTATNISSSSGVGFSSFATVTFANSTITARGALIYNTTPSALSNSGAVLTNPAVLVLDFGSDKSSSASSFTVVFPTADSDMAIVRFGP